MEPGYQCMWSPTAGFDLETTASEWLHLISYYLHLESRRFLHKWCSRYWNALAMMPLISAWRDSLPIGLRWRQDRSWWPTVFNSDPHMHWWGWNSSAPTRKTQSDTSFIVAQAQSQGRGVQDIDPSTRWSWSYSWQSCTSLCICPH